MARSKIVYWNQGSHDQGYFIKSRIVNEKVMTRIFYHCQTLGSLFKMVFAANAVYNQPKIQ